MFARLRICVAAILVTLIPSVAFSQTRETVRIGVVIDGPWRNNNQVQTMMAKEILDLTADEFDVQFPADKVIVGDWTIDSVHNAIGQLLTDTTVDMIITLGVLSSYLVTQQPSLPKPVIAPFFIESGTQGTAVRGVGSGVPNLNYVSLPNQLLRDVKAFADIVPFQRLALLINPTVGELPNVQANVDEMLRSVDADIELIPVRTGLVGLEEQLKEFDAVYTTALLHLPDADIDSLVQICIRRKLPSFALIGRSQVERGILASVNDDIFPPISRRVALNIQRILLGDAPESLPTAFLTGERLTINMATARAIDIFPSWGVLTEAVLLNRRSDPTGRLITLERAAREAVIANPGLLAQYRSVAAGEQQALIARSNLFPQIDLGLGGLQIDRERAERSFGQQPERSLVGNATLNQVIYADGVWANKTIERRLQNANELDLFAFELDIAQEGASAYLSVLRTNSLERIREENLRRTRTNLELARVREAIGTARAAETLRWESELATNRTDVIVANADRNIAEINLNRVLNRPAEESFDTQEADMDDPNLLLRESRLTQYINNPWDFRVFRAFMAQEGLRRAPELKAIDETLAAARRAKTAASRAFWLPDFNLFGAVDYTFVREGEGSEPPPGQNVFVLPEDLAWSVGIQATYNLLSGGARLHRNTQAAETILELSFQRDDASRRIEQRIATAMHRMGAAYAAIAQTQIAADAAKETLDLVVDAYGRGAANIIDVIDAQNNSLVAEETAVEAVFRFMIDLMEAQRSVGILVLHMSDDDKTSFFNALDQYMFQVQNGN